MLDDKNPIEELVHLYVDGAFSRRELMERVSKYTGGFAAAALALAALGVGTAEAQTTTCPADVTVPEGAPGIQSRSVSYRGEGGVTLLGYLAYPFPTPVEQSPAVIVIHENRGLVDHIKDVTRRVARAGFVGLAPDLLSRQGGTGLFTDATTQAQAYGRTLPGERLADLFSSMTFLKLQPTVRWQQL